MARSDKARFSRNAKPQLLAEYFHGQQGMTRQKRLALVIGTDADENDFDFTPSFLLDDEEPYVNVWESGWSEDDLYGDDEHECCCCTGTCGEIDEQYEEMDIAWEWYEHLRPTRQDMLCAPGTCELCDLCQPGR
jgi:hypothetical protein